MFDTDDYDHNRVTDNDIEIAMERQGWRATKIAFSASREDAFVLIGNSWQRMDLTDDWKPHDPIPGYIPEDQVESFYRWIDADRDKAHRNGWRFGENAMRSAIRNLIGAASLVDLETRD